MTTKKLIIFTDAAEPQVNGVVNTLKETKKQLEKLNYEVVMVTPNDFRFSISLPTYKEIRLALPSKRNIHKIIKQHKPDYIHIATEGPIGYQAARVCQKKKISYTSSYHTNFPEYVNQRFSFVKEQYVYSYLRKIHNKAKCTLVTTNSMERKLNGNNIGKNIIVWGRGVDLSNFNFTSKIHDNNKLRLLYVGRVSHEKNIESFLNVNENFFLMDVEKIVVGDGPQLKELQNKYSNQDNIKFLGVKKGKDLEKEYQKADIFVFPSKTDTFGIVMLEAMACGTPVAAFNVTGPRDLIIPQINGHMDDDINVAVLKCVNMNKIKCSRSIQDLTWENITHNFITALEYHN